MSSREVTLDGGSPWGFRMHGGADGQLPLRIARVNPGSKAALRGIREGDLISSINGRSTSGLTNAEAHALLRSAQDTLTLGLNQGVTGSPKRRSQKLAQDIKEENSKRTIVTSSSSSTNNINLSTISYSAASNLQHSIESTHTNGDFSHTENKTKNRNLEPLSSYTTIRNGSPFTTPQGATAAIDNDKSRDILTENEVTELRACCNESAAAVDDLVIGGAREKVHLSAVIMADNGGSSRSRRQRRSRRNRRNKPNTAAVSDSVGIVLEKDAFTGETSEIIPEVCSATCEDCEVRILSSTASNPTETIKNISDTFPATLDVENLCKTLKIVPQTSKKSGEETTVTKTPEVCPATCKVEILNSLAASNPGPIIKNTYESYDTFPSNLDDENLCKALKIVPEASDKSGKETTGTKIPKIIPEVCPATCKVRILNSPAVRNPAEIIKNTSDTFPATLDDENLCKALKIVPETSEKSEEEASGTKTPEIITEVCPATETTITNSEITSASSEVVELDSTVPVITVEVNSELKITENATNSNRIPSEPLKIVPKVNNLLETETLNANTSINVPQTDHASLSEQSVMSSEVDIELKLTKNASESITAILETQDSCEKTSKIDTVPKKDTSGIETTKIIHDHTTEVAKNSLETGFADKNVKKPKNFKKSDKTTAVITEKEPVFEKLVNTAELTPVVQSTSTSSKVKKSRKIKNTVATSFIGTSTVISEIIPEPESQKNMSEDTPASQNDSDNRLPIEEPNTSYKVEFPTLEKQDKDKKSSTNMIKSRSLDDDDQVKITELSEEEKTVCLSDCTAVVSEAESDIEWEVVGDLDEENSEKQVGKLSIISLPLEEHVTYETSHISPEDERSLRDFLEGLNLVGSPEDSARRIENTSTDTKTKKAKKRAILAQHFLPYYQNARYLDVISEEGSDLSDRDCKQKSNYAAHMFDFHEVEDEDDVFEEPNLKQTKLRDKFQTHFASVPNEAILVGTKMFEANNTDTVIIKEGLWTTSIAETQSGAELVFLEDSSNSLTPSDLLDQEDTIGDLDADDEDDISVDLDQSCLELNDTELNLSKLDLNSEQNSLNSSETEINSLKVETGIDSSKTSLNTSLTEIDSMSSSGDLTSRASLPTDTEIKSEINDSLSNDNKETSTPSANTIDFLQKLLFTLNNNSKDILIDLSETGAQNLPVPLKDKLFNFTKNSENKNELVSEINNLKETISRSNSQEKENLVQDETNITETEVINELNIKETYEKSEKIFITKKYLNEEYISNDFENKDSEFSTKNFPENESIMCTNLDNKKSDLETSSEQLNNEELKHELKNFCDNLEPTNDLKQSDSTRASESRSNSASSARSSQCTAVYNPLHSSLTNIAAMLREGSYENSTEPLTLREICVRKLMDLPFGGDIIEELAKVSKSIEDIAYPSSLPFNITSLALKLQNLSTSKNKSSDIDATFILPVDTPVVHSDPEMVEKWVGLPLEQNPNYLVYLSPKQKEFIDRTKAVPKEADSLLDLHRKFTERRTYQDNILTLKPKDVPTFKVQVNSDVNSNNLLKIIQDSSSTKNYKPFEQTTPNMSYFEPKFEQPSGNIRYDKYIKKLVREVPIEVEKQMNKPVNNKIYRDAPKQDTNFHGDRLKAKHLGEWLNLARSNYNYEQQTKETSPRRYSLPFELYEEQMKYILEKEREVKKEIEKLNEEKSKLEADLTPDSPKTFDAAKYQISRKGDIAILSENEKPSTKLFPNTEKFREQMYNEYVTKFEERQMRKQNKVIKVKISEEIHETDAQYEVKHVCGIEDEFMNKVREKKEKLGLLEEDNEEQILKDNLLNPVKILDGESIADVTNLPKHLQEFVDLTNTNAESSSGVWSPGNSKDPEPPLPVASEEKSDRGAPEPTPTEGERKEGDEPAPVVWTPRSAGSSPTAERKEFRPVNFESPVLKRKNPKQESSAPSETISSIQPPWKNKEAAATTVIKEVTEERRLTSSQSAPAAGLTSLGKLPRAQNPTITLLQKAREGQLPRGASYIEAPQPPSPIPRSKDSRPPLIGPHEILYTVKNEYLSESENEKPKKMADLGPRKFEGIGPTTKDGMPIVLRSIYDEQEVKDSNQAKWYKRMYDTLHRAKNDDEYVTVRYKTRRGRYPYTAPGGYLSEPEPNAYDSDAGISASKYATLDRRRYQTGKDKENEYITYTVPRNKYMSASVRHSTDVYKNQPGRIENYVPGHSSISEKEAKEWWDEVMEIFDGHLEQQRLVPSNKSFMSHALKESGYESDSTLVFRRREDAASQLSPHEQKEAYKTIQKGGEVPLHGLRKPAPERPKDDSEIEYFPISPTLTRIRVHKNPKPINEILCYPITIPPHPPQVFSTYKRTAPSLSISRSPVRPPSPPKRRSSRNSHTLKLISTMTTHRPQSPKLAHRHETCFKSPADKSNVKFLRDRISCKLKSPTVSKKAVKVTKTISTYPSSSKESIITTASSKETTKRPKNEVSTTSNIARRYCRHCSFSVPPKIAEKDKPVIKNRAISLERTFGQEKRKVNLKLSKISSDSRFKLVKSPDLTSPNEVKKGVEKQRDILNTEKYPPGTTVKKSTSLFASAKNGLKTGKEMDKSLNVTVAFTAKGKELLNSTKKPLKSTISNTGRMSRTTTNSPIRMSRITTSSPVPSTISEKSKSSIKSRTISSESLKSPVLKKRNITPVAIPKIKSTNKVKKRDDVSNSDSEKKRNRKVKKDQSNEELKKDKKSPRQIKMVNNDRNKTKKCISKATGTEIVNKLKEIENIPQTELIKKQHEEIAKTDTFFQNLFLRNMMSSPTPSVISNKSSYILERTKMLQNQQSSFYSEPTVAALKVYLNNRKPVSESKFKALDQEIFSRSRSVSPCGFNRSFLTHRARFDSISEVSNESHGSRHLSPDSVYSKRSSSLPATKIVFSETSRPVSPSLEKSLVAYRSSSPSPIRSPSRRKIHSLKPATITVEGISGVKQKSLRARSAGEAESLKRELYYKELNLTPSVSSLSLSQLLDPNEYKTYVAELRHSAKKSERFKELNRFYSSLERLGHLERTTSSSDLRPRRRNEEEIIDYDRWMQVRKRERAEQEFNILYKKLKQEQKDKDLLFKTKDIENFRWNYNREFGLKIKEHSVENIKEQFEKLKDTETPLEISKRRILNYQKDTYKPLWRGDSVVNLVTKISERRSQSEERGALARQKYYTERLLNREIGSKLWSSLSTEQVNTLKNQLAEIYSSDNKRDDYYINFDEKACKVKPKTLAIRRNSAEIITKPQPIQQSASVGAISTNQTLSESEKKRLSLSLSREVKDRMSQKRKYTSALSVVLGKETRGAIAAAEAKIKPSTEITSPRTCYSLEPTEDDAKCKEEDKNFVLVLAKDDTEKQNLSQTLDEWAQPKTETAVVTSKKQPSVSETESASSDTSTKTAIFVGKKEDVHKKIEYFEKNVNVDNYVPTIHKPAEDDEFDEKSDEGPKIPRLVSSQSYADLKELFGEKELMKFATIPLSATRKSTPKRPLLRVTNFSPVRTVSEASSFESIRSRSISPDTDRFWNAYLTLIRGVDVGKLTKKFEHLEDFYSNREINRSKSDSELTSKDFGDVFWLKRKYENLSRGRSRTRKQISPIAKTSFKDGDRLMPHINIISKLASLYPKRIERREKSIEDLARDLGCPLGEVEKIREKFESPERDVSILGQMYTSSPNIHELRDIAPYLAGSWIAHQYPKFQDNSRSASAPEENGTNRALIRKNRPRPKSASPPRTKKPPSILKSKDVFANQKYEPNIHRPLYRYQPKTNGRTRSWSPTAKLSVKFKEPVLGLKIPMEDQYDNRYVSPESPRKYVEDEVTIHYRSPVRHEVKEIVSEEELARRQAEAMRRIYQEERRRKYLQELQDMNSRRHTDNFIPSQKSPIPLNRYDDFGDDLSVKLRGRSRSPEPRIVARALYNFVGQSARELTFRKGDIIFIRRQVDKNWFEGEHNAMLGLFPSNYVEIIPYDGIKSTPRKAHEGQARAKFNFIAQTNLELSLAKGELVVLTRRVDDNWFEGRIGSRKGIFPVSYVEILIDPSEKSEISSSKPVASPAAHSLLLNGSAGGKESMGSHHYQPSYSAPQSTSYHAKPVNVIGTSSSYSSLTRSHKIGPGVNEALHIDTQSEPVPYRALYKYRPQNDDELELQEGDTVFVLEKCDDGWYVGSSQRTGSFGTFPGNYVERI